MISRLIRYLSEFGPTRVLRKCYFIWLLSD
jgi:hypothetical protein